MNEPHSAVCVSWRRSACSGARGAQPRRGAAEGALQALAPDRDRADGAFADRGDVRIHAASLGTGDPPAFRGGGARRRGADRPLSEASARRGRHLSGQSGVRTVSHGRDLAAGRSSAAGDASILLRGTGSADANPSQRNQEAGRAAFLARYRRPIGPDGNPRRSRRPSASPGDPPRARLRGERPYFRALDARRDDRPADRCDHFPSQSDPAHPASRASGGGFRQGPGSRLQTPMARARSGRRATPSSK